MITTLSIPYLSVAIAIPLLGALLVALLPERLLKHLKWISLIFAALPFFIWCWLVVRFRGIGGFEFDEFYHWIDFFQVNYWVGMDGLSLPFIGLTVCLVPLFLWWDLTTRSIDRSRTVLFLLLEVSLLGAFSALDLFLFYLFMEVGVIVVYFLIGLQETSRGAAAKAFLFFNLLGSGAFLLVMAQLYVLANHSLNLADLKAIPMETDVQYRLAGIFLFGVACKVALVPLHLWLSRAVAALTIGGQILLLALFVKIGLYALWRYGVVLFPEGMQLWAPTLKGVGLLTLLYGGALSLFQKEWAARATYWTVFAIGFSLYALALFNLNGAEGALFFLVSHGALIAALLLVAEACESPEQAGSWRLVWVGMILFVLAALCGLPGTAGFVGSFLVLTEGFQQDRSGVLWVMLGWGLLVLSLLRGMLAALKTSDAVTVPPRWGRQRLGLTGLLLLLILVGGLKPQLFLESSRTAFEQILEKIISDVAVQPDN